MWKLFKFGWILIMINGVFIIKQLETFVLRETPMILFICVVDGEAYWIIKILEL